MRLAGMTAFRVRITETAGMPLSRLLPSTNPWGASDCGQLDRLVCDQGDEVKQDCKRRNILYESSCTICRVDIKEDDTDEAGKKELFLKDGKGLYIGESSRSIYERSKEHHRDRQDKNEDSHQIKHWVTDHPELDSPPKFRYKVVSSFQDALTRQVAESVRIERAGVHILNSKAEYSRCRIPRLRVDMEGWKKLTNEKQLKPIVEDKVEEDKDFDFEELEHTTRRMESKRKMEEEGGKGKGKGRERKS